MSTPATPRTPLPPPPQPLFHPRIWGVNVNRLVTPEMTIVLEPFQPPHSYLSQAICLQPLKSKQQQRREWQCKKRGYEELHHDLNDEITLSNEIANELFEIHVADSSHEDSDDEKENVNDCEKYSAVNFLHEEFIRSGEYQTSKHDSESTSSSSSILSTYLSLPPPLPPLPPHLHRRQLTHHRQLTTEFPILPSATSAFPILPDVEPLGATPSRHDIYCISSPFDQISSFDFKYDINHYPPHEDVSTLDATTALELNYSHNISLHSSSTLISPRNLDRKKSETNTEIFDHPTLKNVKTWRGPSEQNEEPEEVIQIHISPKDGNHLTDDEEDIENIQLNANSQIGNHRAQYIDKGITKQDTHKTTSQFSPYSIFYYSPRHPTNSNESTLSRSFTDSKNLTPSTSTQCENSHSHSNQSAGTDMTSISRATSRLARTTSLVSEKTMVKSSRRRVSFR